MTPLVAALVASLSGVPAHTVYGLELPDSVTSGTVVELSGGTTLYDGPGALHSQRVDIRCYAETPTLALADAQSILQHMRQMRRATVAGVLLQTARVSAGMRNLRDPDTDAPFVFQSFQIIYAEQAP